MTPKNGEILKRTGAVMHSNGGMLFICGGRDANQALCNSVIVYNIGKRNFILYFVKIQDTDIWRVFQMDPSSEPVHTCCLYLNQLLIIRGRRIEVAWEKGTWELLGGIRI